MQATGIYSESKAMLWTGRVINAVVVLFLTFDVAVKLVEMDVVRESMLRLGYSEPLAGGFAVGMIELICLALYVFPRTSVLGAILLTAIMGGAIASHMRIGDPLFSHTLFGVYLGVMLWAALYLRDGKLRALIPLRSAAA